MPATHGRRLRLLGAGLAAACLAQLPLAAATHASSPTPTRTATVSTAAAKAATAANTATAASPSTRAAAAPADDTCATKPRPAGKVLQGTGRTGTAPPTASTPAWAGYRSPTAVSPSTATT